MVANFSLQQGIKDHRGAFTQPKYLIGLKIWKMGLIILHKFQLILAGLILNFSP